MKKLFWIGIIFSCTAVIHAGPYDWSLTMTPDSKMVTISSTSANPTQIFTKDSNVQRSWVVNTTTFTVFISSVSNNLSTSSFGIPGVGTSGNAPVIWTPDGVNAPYEGALWAFMNTQSTTTISVFRSK